MPQVKFAPRAVDVGAAIGDVAVRDRFLGGRDDADCDSGDLGRCACGNFDLFYRNDGCPRKVAEQQVSSGQHDRKDGHRDRIGSYLLDRAGDEAAL